MPTTQHRVGSRTRPYVWYLVALNVDDETGEVTGACNCPGDRWVSDCTHILFAKGQTKMTAPTSTAMVAIPDDDRMALAPVVPSPPRRLIPDADEIRGIVELANRAPMAAGTALPAHLNNPGVAFACFLAGWELGVRPMTAARHIAVVNGRAEPDSQLMQGIVLANDPSAEFRYVEYGLDGVTCELWRTPRGRTEPVLRAKCRYTPEDQYRAEQGYRRKVLRWEPTSRGKDRPVFEIDPNGRPVLERVDGPWWTHTALMMAYNAARLCCKLGAPDIINGVLASSASASEALMVAEQMANETDWDLPALAQPNQQVDLTTGNVATPAPARRVLLAQVTAKMQEHEVSADELAAFVGGRSIRFVEDYLAGTGNDLGELFNQILDHRENAPRDTEMSAGPASVEVTATVEQSPADPSWPADLPPERRRGSAPRSHASEAAQDAQNGE